MMLRGFDFKSALTTLKNYKVLLYRHNLSSHLLICKFQQRMLEHK